MKERVQRLGLAIVSLGIIAFSLANLYPAVTVGEVRARRDWVALDEQPLLFFAIVAVYAVGALLFSAGLYVAWRQHRAFGRILRRRPPLEEARRRPADRR